MFAAVRSVRERHVFVMPSCRSGYSDCLCLRSQVSPRFADTVRDDSELIDKHWVTTPYRPEQQGKMLDAVSRNINIGIMPPAKHVMLI